MRENGVYFELIYFNYSSYPALNRGGEFDSCLHYEVLTSDMTATAFHDCTMIPDTETKVLLFMYWNIFCQVCKDDDPLKKDHLL